MFVNGKYNQSVFAICFLLKRTWHVCVCENVAQCPRSRMKRAAQSIENRFLWLLLKGDTINIIAFLHLLATQYQHRCQTCQTINQSNNSNRTVYAITHTYSSIYFDLLTCMRFNLQLQNIIFFDEDTIFVCAFLLLH